MGVLRFVLAWFVVAAHVDLVGTGGVRYAGPFALFVFYAVSGYYMTLTLGSRYAVPGGLRAYYVNRAVRILPMYLFMLAVAAPLVFASASTTREAWGALSPGARAVAALAQATPFGQEAMHGFEVKGSSLAFTPDFRSAALPAWHLLLLPTCWSLSLECWFYLLAPAVVRRSALTRCVIAALSLGLWVPVLALGAPPDPWIYRMFPASLAFFMAGSVVRSLQERAGSPAARLAAWAGARPRAAAAAIGGFLALLVAWRLAAPRWDGPGAPAALVPLYGVALVLLPALFALSGGTSAVARADRWLADLTWPMFLLHYPVIRLTGWTRTADIVAVTAAGSAVALLLVERLTARLKADPGGGRAVTGRAPSAASPPASATAAP